MRWTIVLLATIAASPGRARASEPGELRVERAAAAKGCPDAVALTRAVDAVRERSGAPNALSHYRVVFSRTSDGFHANIESLRDHTTRSLSDRASTCEALARATTVTLALLLDADADANADAAPVKADTTRSASRHDVTAVVSGEPPSSVDSGASDSAVTLHAAAGVLVGSIRPLAPMFTGGAGIELRSFSANVGAAWAPPGEIALAPGHVTTSFLGITLESCVILTRGQPRLDACSGLLAGFVRAEARGYTRNEARSRAWLALPIGLGASARVSDGFALRLQASLLVPVRQQEFRVDGVGIAYESPPVAGVLTLRATTRFLF